MNQTQTLKGSAIFQNPVVLLLITGTLLGFNLPLGKLAANAGIAPILWSLIVSLGVFVVLMPSLITKRQLSIPQGVVIRYVIISAFISFIIPNILLFSVIPHVGAGYAGLMYALSPVFTLALATIFKLNTPNKIGVIGIILGFIGAITVSVTRGIEPEAPPILWIFAALCIPLSLACGNIYRTLDWPDKALPDSLAFWSHTFSVIVYIILLFIIYGTVPMLGLFSVPYLVLVQMFVAGMMFPAFFRLQQNGGPVLLSQIGYIAAAIGLLVATTILNEQYSSMTWLGAAIIAVGILVTITAQIKK